VQLGKKSIDVKQSVDPKCPFSRPTKFFVGKNVKKRLMSEMENERRKDREAYIIIIKKKTIIICR
jgi:hypothetical protein